MRLSRQQRTEIYALNAIATHIEIQKFKRFMEQKKECGEEEIKYGPMTNFVGSDSEEEETKS